MITNIIFRRSDSPITSDKPHYPYELPKGWCWTTLGEICCIKGGKRIPRGMTFAKGKTAHIYIRVTDMKDNTIKLSDLKYIDDYVYEHIKNYTINASDLYLTIAGTIGSVGIVPNEVDGMNLTENAAKLTQIGCIKEYLLYALLSTIAQEHFISRFHQVAQPKLSIETASKTPIAMPPIGEQIRIVKEIKRYLAAIKIIEEGQTDLETTISQTKSKILDLAIHGKLVPQDPTDEPATELLKRINPNAEITSDNGHYQKLPEGWCECTLGSLFLFIRNGINIHQDKSKIGYPITRIETISSEFIDRSRMGYAAITEDNYSDYYLQKDDILMSHINSPIHVGKCALCDIKAGEKIIHGMNLLCLRPYPDIEAKFILMVFRSPYFKDEIRPFIKNAVNQASINIRNLSSVLLHLPPVSEQHRIVAKIEEIFAQLDAIEASLLPT